MRISYWSSDVCSSDLSALALGVLAERAGLPPGVLNIVTGHDAAAIGGEMTANPKVRKLSVTGSTAVDKRLMAQCADDMKRVSKIGRASCRKRGCQYV